MNDLIIGGIYLHYKNKKYKVLGTAIHSETLEEVVIYEALYENPLGKMWVRPKKMFCETISTDQYKGPRFKYIEE